MYLYGSTMTNEAEKWSDIDMLIHTDTDQKKVEEIIEKLGKGVLRAYTRVHKVDMRTGAYILAIRRGAEAIEAQEAVPIIYGLI